MKKKTVKIPMYHGRLHIIFGEKLEAIAKKYGFGNARWEHMDACYYNPDGAKPNYYIAFEEDATPGIIAHECLHAVNDILADRGVSLDPDNDEPQCYFLGWMVDEVIKAKFAYEKDMEVVGYEDVVTDNFESGPFQKYGSDKCSIIATEPKENKLAVPRVVKYTGTDRSIGHELILVNDDIVPTRGYGGISTAMCLVRETDMKSPAFYVPTHLIDEKE